MDDNGESSKGPAYATFTLRARALVIDAAVVAAFLAILVIVSSFVDQVPGSGRIMLAAILGVVFFYEPVLVWRYGATIGHRRTNIRVVSDVSGGPPSFPKAFSRFLVKALLGLPSFVAMVFTRRHQALHDVVTGTTVQIRDRSLAAPDDFLEERETPDVDIPRVPAWRRALGVMIYGSLSYVLLAIISAAVLGAECLADDSACTGVEDTLAGILSLAWLAIAVLIMVVGWRGRLPGFRHARVKNETAAT